MTLLTNLAGYLYRQPDLLFALSRYEDRRYAEHLPAIDRPIWITGLARSGTTILLQLLADAPEAATHRHRDYPFVHTPILWNRLQALLPRGDTTPRERAHRDRLLETPDSPEAMEEPIWQHFFAQAHDVSRPSALETNAAFDAFFQQHLRKLLYLRGGTRYLAKANYNLPRIPYLLRLFPDARFICLIRHPYSFIASSLKQDALFTAEQTADPSKLRHTQLSGHYEFGLDKRPIHFGEDTTQQQILSDFANPDRSAQLTAWARYWAAGAAYLHAQRDNPALCLLRYEDLCADPRGSLQRIATHTGLTLPADLIAHAEATVSPPDYYPATLPEADRTGLASTLSPMAAAFDYTL